MAGFLRFDEATALDLVDGLRLLEGRLAGGRRRLSPGARELREAAERSLRVRTDQRAAGSARAEDDDDVSAYLLTIADVAERLHVSVPTVKRLVSSGTLPSVQINERCRRVRPADLSAYIAALVPTTTTGAPT